VESAAASLEGSLLHVMRADDDGRALDESFIMPRSNSSNPMILDAQGLAFVDIG
jgi:hypothetical protein